MQKQVDSRYQMIQCCLDDMISDDNPVRVLDVIIDYLFRQPGVEDPTGKSRLGRRAFSGQDLTKLLIYGYLNGITSSRNLDEATHVNRELNWLIRDQHPSYKTIANFRKDNLVLLVSIFGKLLELLQSEQMITGKVWVIDGNKTKANARRDMDSVVNLRQQISKLDLSIEEALKQINEKESGSKQSTDDNDAGSDAGSSAPKDVAELDTELQESIKKRSKKQALLDKALSSGKKYISGSDEDALLLSTRRGKCAGHNVQYVVDAAHHFIVGAQLVDESNDTNALYRTLKDTCIKTGIKPQQIIADRGYSNYKDIRKVREEISEDVFVSLQRTKRQVENLDFRVDKESGAVICPQGRVMRMRGRRIARGVHYQSFYHIGCLGCPINEKCAKNRNSRTYLLSENHEFIELYRAKMQTFEAQTITGKRKTIIEHVFGTLAQMMQYNGFKLRTNAKVPIEIYLYSISYNFKRLLNLLRSMNPKGGKLGLLCLKSLCALIFTYFALIWSRIRRCLSVRESIWLNHSPEYSLFTNCESI